MPSDETVRRDTIAKSTRNKSPRTTIRLMDAVIWIFGFRFMAAIDIYTIVLAGSASVSAEENGSG